ncbi:hypothetical protein [uncultured Draconibacterium sp.]|uniref:hypothetical protein n=1 Tax=uncultured Draconibacterium sp. TaxID=1573823 RepID=UPI0029C75600|nr:hypothetical protein [uncultured Draconibacterium sp.]
MAFDYKNPKVNDWLSQPDQLPEYEDKANELIIKACGKFPYESVGLVSGVFTVRAMIKANEKGGGTVISEEEFLERIPGMF